MKHIITILALTAASALAQQINLNENVNRNRNVFRPSNNNLNLNNVENRVNNNVNNRVNTNVNNRVTNNSSAKSNATANPVVNVQGDTSITPSVTVDATEWARWQKERKQYSRTKRGSTISPFDPRSAQVIVSQVDKNAKSRYDSFLISQGHNPNTLGHATLVDGKMVVPSTTEIYAGKVSKAEANISSK